MNSRRAGFTVVELVIVVVILGVLAAVALPAMTRYKRRSQSAEAMSNLGGIYNAESVYWSRTNSTAATGSGSPAQFAACSPSPAAVPRAQKLNGVWTSGGWESLGFAPDRPLYYQYQVTTAGTGSDAVGTVTAVGDLDGNGTDSLFLRTLSIAHGEVVGTLVSTSNELE